jgi:hypothetical protein
LLDESGEEGEKNGDDDDGEDGDGTGDGEARRMEDRSDAQLSLRRRPPSPNDGDDLWRGGRRSVVANMLALNMIVHDAGKYRSVTHRTI